MNGYVVKIEKDGNSYFASFPDVPEAATGGDSLKETLLLAEDVLLTTIVGYMALKKAVPLAVTRPKKNDRVINLPEQVYIKVLLWNEMLKQRISKSSLAQRLKKTEGYVRKLLDPYSNVTIASLVEAARALNKRIDVSLSDVCNEEIERLTDHISKREKKPKNRIAKNIGSNAGPIACAVRIHGRRTSIRLEPELWLSLREIAVLEGCSVHDICSAVFDLKAEGISFTSALKVFLTEYYRAAARAQSQIMAVDKRLREQIRINSTSGQVIKFSDAKGKEKIRKRT